MVGDGIRIPPVGNSLRAEIAEVQGMLTWIKEHQSVAISNILGHVQMNRAYGET